ncbi:MAG TPA: bifunctional diguanylate cyclase/phosphodiesterase [Vitreimonas sp.]|uniref:bifunctional diguanylate cyclase/phosphodiesterase n=1 Tax=Vitreimonas sp. TaxID=3069702 RepID=UPI002D69438A|nr:bifunctional diguanylate cyclase/phosphodiesterase [Vitreimonas sp.]HYD87784.1 bifunctional diguanylate cyclase/phosphodiesterase [Vitreimonas sp.]
MVGAQTQLQRGFARFVSGGVPASNALAMAAAVCSAAGVLLLWQGLEASVAQIVLVGGLFMGPSAVLVLSLLRTRRSIRTLADRLAQCADDPNGSRGADEFERIEANLEAVVEKLERPNARDCVTHLPMRDEFLSGVNADLRRSGGESLIGLVRLANYERVFAFDGAAAHRVLAAFAGRLRDAVHAARRIGHVDRDCFAIWFDGVDRKRAEAELKALTYVLTQELRDAMLTMAPDVQLGSAIYPLDAEDAASLLNRAFVSLARPQRTAEGRIAFFAPPSPQEARRCFAIEQELRQAIERNQLSLHYQPFVDVAAGKVIGAEALLRWTHPKLGDVPPAQFVAIMEEAGLVDEIGLWILNTACRQLSAWRNTPLADLRVAINLSAVQFRDPALKTALQRTLASHKLSPEQLILELTETVAMEDAGRTLQTFQDLKALGFGLAIDDFGSGYSSLGYLKKLPFSKLKIDREFVTQIDQRPDSRAICRALVELSNGLGISVLAEGVERYEEVEELRRLGCSAFQGFYFAAPMPAAAFAKHVTDEAWLSLIGSRVRRDHAEIRRRLL